MVEDVIMCRSRRRRKQSNAQTGMTDDEMRAAIEEANRKEAEARAKEATALARIEDINAAKADTIQD